MLPNDLNKWFVEGIKNAMTSLDRGGGVAHGDVRRWVESWGSKNELQAPRTRRVDKIARD